MGDSIGMTIEFLRARLLSERSVSKTARQRADQLAKRVMELEEQLRIMTIQRKKAERAAGEVLAILENHRVGDFHEDVDSSSDQDDTDGGLQGNNIKEDEDSTLLRMEKSEAEDGLSGSELGTSPPSHHRSLSWKGRSKSPKYRQSHKIKQFRQKQGKNSLLSDTESSGKNYVGKSCRKFGRREMRSTIEDDLDNAVLDVHGDRGAAKYNHSDELTDLTREASRTEMQDTSPHTAHSLDKQICESAASLYATQRDDDEEMERILEQQAELIVQYQAEENAQREWEDKYNEKKSSKSDLCEPENTPDTRETHDLKEGAFPAAQNLYYTAEGKPMAENISQTEKLTGQSCVNVSLPVCETPHSADRERSVSNTKLSPTDVANGLISTDLSQTGENSSQTFSNDMPSQQYHTIMVSDMETSSPEFAFPFNKVLNTSMNGYKDQGVLYGNTDTGSHGNSSLYPHGNGFLKSPSGSPSSANSGNKFSKLQSPEVQNQLQRLRPQSLDSRLGGVLQALQRAKASLGQIGGRHLSNQDIVATVSPMDYRRRRGGSEILVGSAGLFRLPTDPLPRASFSMPRSYGSELGFTSPHSDIGYATSSNEYRYPARYVESRSIVPVGRQYFDPYATPTTAIPASRRYSLAHSHLTTERNPSGDGFSKSGLDVRNEMPAGDRYTLYGSDSPLPDTKCL